MKEVHDMTPAEVRALRVRFAVKLLRPYLLLAALCLIPLIIGVGLAVPQMVALFHIGLSPTTDPSPDLWAIRLRIFMGMGAAFASTAGLRWCVARAKIRVERERDIALETSQS